ncbi:unnamed protein product [Durusdinium trenchii]|uniref:Ion transport domain-containing protein n=1 Tax=Durusdinium trenchii TaxID=1381693 RepID=A0ABP0IUL0_9DINO
MESAGSPYWCSKRRQGSQKWQIDANGLKTLNEDHLENKGDGGGDIRGQDGKEEHVKATRSCTVTVKRRAVLKTLAAGDTIGREDGFSSRHATGNMSNWALLGDELPSIQASRALVRAYEQVKTPVTASHRIVLWITLVSTIFIFLSFILVGVALDYAPNWFGWKWVDSFFGVFFILESLLKICAMGPRTYFCGREKWWNLFDSGISLAALAELIYNLVSRGIENTMPTRIALTLRVLRLARVSFYMKLIQTPLLQELANIVQGFLVAVPSLFWVLVTLSVVIYVAALAMRATVAQLSSDLQSLDVCGSGDLYDLNVTLPAGCGGLADVYGQEYCGTVLGCMFTIFRCILGDCTTKGGRSLTLMWSHGYGVQFDVFYAFSMVCVIFGMFNIITAIFVEATMNGLKDSETERKYAQAYESNYMTEQLGKIVLSITKHVQNLRKAETVQDRLKRSLSWGSNSSTDSMDKEMFLTEEEFISAIRATDVRMLLDDLDVVLEPRPGVFEAFNSEEDGTVSMSELVSGLMSFRGELHKVGVSLGIPKTIPRATPAAPRQKLLIFGKQPRRESVLFEYHRHPWVALVEMLMLIQDVGGTRTNPVLHMLLDKRRGERRGMVDVAALSPLWHIARETMVVRPRPEDGDVSCKEMESCCACLSRLISVLGALLVVFLALFGMACVVIDGVVRVQKDLPLYELGAHTIVQRAKAFVKSLSLTFPEAFLTMVSEKLLDEAKLMLSTALGGLLEYLSNVIFELLMLGLYVLFWLCTPMPIASTTETIFRRYLFLKGTACR